MYVFLDILTKKKQKKKQQKKKQKKQQHYIILHQLCGKHRVNTEIFF